MQRYQLTDEQWELIQPLFPEREEPRGRPPTSPRKVLNAILWILRSGAPWRDLLERYGPWQTIYHHFNTWRREGKFDALMEALQIRLDRDGQIDWDLWGIDGSSVRAARAAAGAGKKGGPKSPPTTRWAARAAAGGASSTWWRTATAIRSRSTSRPGKSTSRRSSRRS